jgi:hypothetical protein
MAVQVTHATQTSKPNDSSKDVSANAWNEAHTITGLGDAAGKDVGTGADDVAAGDHAHASLPGLELTDNLVLPKTSGKGILIDDTYGWRDLLGPINIRDTASVLNPGYNVYRGGIRGYQFAVNDECFIEFHLPHDYAPGTDLHIHAHWSHIATTVTGGSVTWGFEVTYAKGHQQAPFRAPVTASVLQSASATKYQHMIAETQMSAASPSIAQLDTDDIEVDGLILVRAFLQANAMTVSGGGVPEPFLHMVDIHYQSTGVPTKNKAPNFYT